MADVGDVGDIGGDSTPALNSPFRPSPPCRRNLAVVSTVRVNTRFDLIRRPNRRLMIPGTMRNTSENEGCVEPARHPNGLFISEVTFLSGEASPYLLRICLHHSAYIDRVSLIVRNHPSA